MNIIIFHHSLFLLQAENEQSEKKTQEGESYSQPDNTNFDESSKSQEHLESVHEQSETSSIQESQSSTDVSIDHSKSADEVNVPMQDEEEEELDFVHTLEWKNKKKHFFILSEAGKPIYSR